MYLDRLTEQEVADVFVLVELGMKCGTFIYSQLQNKELIQGQQDVSALLKNYTSINPFMFKGEETDLSYFWDSKKLDIKELENITDVKLKKNVKDVLENAFNNKYLKIVDNDTFVLTEKGGEYIYSSDFASKVVKSNDNINNQILNGMKGYYGTRDNSKINFNDNLISNENEIQYEHNKNQTYYQFLSEKEYEIVKKSEIPHSLSKNNNVQIKGLKTILVNEEELKQTCKVLNKNFKDEFNFSKNVTNDLMKGANLNDVLKSFNKIPKGMGYQIAQELSKYIVKNIVR